VRLCRRRRLFRFTRSCRAALLSALKKVRCATVIEEFFFERESNRVFVFLMVARLEIAFVDTDVDEAVLECALARLLRVPMERIDVLPDTDNPNTADIALLSLADGVGSDVLASELAAQSDDELEEVGLVDASIVLVSGGVPTTTMPPTTSTASTTGGVTTGDGPATTSGNAVVPTPSQDTTADPMSSLQESTDEEGFPGWAIALIVIGALLLLASIIGGKRSTCARFTLLPHSLWRVS